MSEDKQFKIVLDKAKELETLDFSNESEFKLAEYYSALEKIAKKNETAKNEEAEFIVDKDAVELIDKDFIEELEIKRLSVENFIRMYDPNNELTKSLELHEVDKVYAISNYLLNSYIQYVNEMKFIFVLTKDEAKFLRKILFHEIPYNGDEVFNFAELNKLFLFDMKNQLELNRDDETYTFNVSIKSILILHHLIKGHSVKGVTSDFTQFSGVLHKIAAINKLFNAYNIIIERIKTDRELWGSGLDEIAKLKDPEFQKEMEAYAEQKALEQKDNVDKA